MYVAFANDASHSQCLCIQKRENQTEEVSAKPDKSNGSFADRIWAENAEKKLHICEYALYLTATEQIAWIVCDCTRLEIQLEIIRNERTNSGN